MFSGVNKKSLIGIAIFCFAGMATNMTMGILGLIMGSYPDVSPVTVQSVLVGPALIGTLYAFVVGTLNRTFSAKKLAMFAQAALLAYGCIFLFLGGSAPIAVLIAASGLAGFNQGSTNTILALLMLEACPEEGKRGTLIGIFTSVMSIGGVLFSTLGGVMAATRWQNAYYLFFYYAVAIVLELILLPNVAPEGKVAPAAAGDAPKVDAKVPVKVWAISIHYFFFFLWLYVFGTNCSEFILNTYKIGGPAEAGVAASCVTIGGIFAGFLYGAYSKILKKFTVPVLIGLSCVGLAVPVFITNSVVGIYAAGILLGFAMMGANPYIMMYLGQICQGPTFGKAMSVFMGFMNAGMVVAIYVIAFLTQIFFGDGSYVPGKFIIALVGNLVVFVTSFFIYCGKEK